jgi:hypothetical protein
VDAYADHGLRGGSTGYRPGPDGVWIRATLRHYQWVSGVGVNGVVSVLADGLGVRGTLTVNDGHGAPVVVTFSWRTTSPRTLATVNVGSSTLVLPAP